MLTSRGNCREKVMKHPSRRVHPRVFRALKQHYLFFAGRTGKLEPPRERTILFSGASPGLFLGIYRGRKSSREL
jgi:hypothetical protein